MKNRITSVFLQGLTVSVAAFLAQTAYCQYNNTGASGGTSSEVGNYTYNNGEVGNEVVLGSGTGLYDISQFDVQFFLTGTTLSGTEQAELNFYSEPTPNTTGAAPGALLFTSGFSPITAFTPASGDQMIYNITADNIPADFTWTITFQGIGSGESAGLSIFNSSTLNGSGVPVPAVGGNFNDAWVNTGGVWSLIQSSPNPNNPGLQFGALITGTQVPEPSTIALGVIGACAFIARRRKQ
jgi:hypothetical protein